MRMQIHLSGRKSSYPDANQITRPPPKLDTHKPTNSSTNHPSPSLTNYELHIFPSSYHSHNQHPYCKIKVGGEGKMDFKHGLFQQQTQKLMMTQDLSQAIALLQYSTQELTSFLESKALENPLIQLESTIVPVNPLVDRKKKRKTTIYQEQNDWIDQLGENKKSLTEHLRSQIPLNEDLTSIRHLMEFFIDSMDENGYLPIHAINGLQGYSNEHIEECLHYIHQMEPAGIGARSLQECLLIQLKKMKPSHQYVIAIVENYFELFAEKQWKLISSKMQIPLTEIQSAFDLVQTLNPRPGSDYFTEQTAFIAPDIVVIWDGEEYKITIFDELLPNISFNGEFYNHYQNHTDKQVNRYLESQWHQYQWLQRSLQQRKETLQRVALKIVEKQPDFFKKGPNNLRPMIMKDIAEELEIHESTVSRAVREKYVQTPFGIFELKSFFTSTIQTTSDEATSSTLVKTKIRAFIEGENKVKPLSDQEIMDILKEQEGMVVSRRTVAKYREQLGIPASSKRKRYE
jgi:RNA polymerase sigma-54 factor